MSLAPGIYTDISPEDYHSDPCEQPSLSASIATILVNQSPAHAYAAHPRLGGHRRAPTKEMDFGSLLHAMLLHEPDAIEVIEVAHPKTGEPVTDFRTKAAKQARDAARAQGKLPLFKAQFDEASEIADTMRAKLQRLGYDLSQGDHEVTLVWDEKADDGTVIRCRGRVDHLLDATINDLKTTASASAGSIANSMIRYGYDIQRAAYCSALETLDPRWAGRVDFTFLFFETVQPFAITPAAPDGTMRELGAWKWRRAINTWAHCLRSNEWPEYTTGRVFVPAPQWALRHELDFDEEVA